MAKRTTHIDRTLQYMQDFGSITSIDAFREFGNTRLSATIFEIRHRYGIPVKSKREVGKNRYGDKTEYVRYYIEEEK